MISLENAHGRPSMGGNKRLLFLRPCAPKKKHHRARGLKHLQQEPVSERLPAAACVRKGLALFDGERTI